MSSVTKTATLSTPRVEPSASDWIIDLSALSLSELESSPQWRGVLGGKGFNLAKLLAASLPVPAAFCVTAAAFNGFVDAAFERAAALSDAAQLLQRAPLPAALSDALLRAYQRLGADVSVAVRSSAVDEDGAQHSFAGQQATLLNVRGVAALEDALKTVWSSLLSPNALLYRSRQSPGTLPAMAVVVQALIPADVAGVLFTHDPVNDTGDEALINAAYGLGETVVSGGVVDTFYIDRRSGQKRRETLGDKRDMLCVDPVQGLTRAKVAARRRSAPSLSLAQIDDLMSLSRRVERLMGGPQDIEFAVADGHLWLLQSRPITTPQRVEHAPILYTNANVGEALPGVGTPMTWSLIRAFAQRGFETAFGALGLDVPPDYQLFASFRGRVYLNISEFFSIASQIPLLSPGLLARISGAGDVGPVRDTYQRLSPWRFLSRLPLTIPRQLFSQLAMPRVARRWQRAFQREHRAFLARDLSRCDAAQLIEVLATLDASFNRTGEVMLACSSNFLLSYVIVSEALRWLGGDDAAAEEAALFSGLTRVSSAAPGLELLEMARFIQDRPRLSRVFTAQEPEVDVDALEQRLRDEPQGRIVLRRLERFLDHWGHRAPLEAEVATPRWRDDPSFLFEVIRGHLLHGERLPSARDIEADQVRLREETTQLIRKHFLTGSGVFFRALLRWSQHNARRREALRSLVVATLERYRRFMLEVGARMTSRGDLCEPDDIFFLTRDEVLSWLRDETSSTRWRYLVAYRQSLHQAFQGAPAPPDTFTLQGTQELLPSAPLQPVSGDQLTGLPGAPGTITGPVRVIRSLDEGEHLRLRPGEILVAPFTDVGWTPLFLVAAGLVTDRGGPLSHSCVVAREYGIPAVVNTQIATSMLETGEIVTVDGSRGVVRFDHTLHRPPPTDDQPAPGNTTQS